MLVRFITEVAGGRGSSVLIGGEPGIGKSARVRASVAEAADVGCQVFWGAGDELGQALPLMPLLEGLRVREPSTDPRQNTIVWLLRDEGTADCGQHHRVGAAGKVGAAGATAGGDDAPGAAAA